MPEQPTPTPVAAPAEEVQRQDPLAAAVAEAVTKLRRTARALRARRGTSARDVADPAPPDGGSALSAFAPVAGASGGGLRVPPAGGVRRAGRAKAQGSGPSEQARHG